MPSCNIRLTRPSGRTESLHLGGEWEEDMGLRLVLEGCLGFWKVLGGSWESSSKSRGPLSWRSKQVSSSELRVCPQHHECAFTVKTGEELQLADGRVSAPHPVIFYLNSTTEGGLLNFYITFSCLLNPKVMSYGHNFFWRAYCSLQIAFFYTHYYICSI